MSIYRKLLTYHGNQEIYSFRMTNRQGMMVDIINFGGVITGIYVPDYNNDVQNVVLHYEKAEDYFDDPFYMGCIVGRYSNRISHSSFTLEGKEYHLSINETALNNHLHGGFSGFNKKVWKVESYGDNSGKSTQVVFSYLSPHLEEGYPGNLITRIRYILHANNELVINYTATTDAATIVNLTNHTYFNLSGRGCNIFDHRIKVNASFYTPLDGHYIPTGNKEAVTGTLYDLKGRKSPEDIAHSIPTINYCIDKLNKEDLAAELYSPVSRRCLKVYTTEPGLQLYFGNFLGSDFSPFDGMAIEPQHYPNSPNCHGFPSTVLMPNQLYEQTTTYKFDVI